MFFKSTIATIFVAICLAFSLHRPDARLPGKIVNGIIFLNANHGYVQLKTLSHPATYETLDGGKTWQRVEEGVPGFRTGRSFATKLTGWSIDERSGEDNWEKWTVDTIYKTKDGGRTWHVSLKTDRKGDFAFGGIQAISETELWVTGISGTYHSTDGGMTWDKSGPPGTAIQFLDAVRGWLRDGKLLRTADGGKTWESVENDGKSCFAAMVFYFLDDYHGWYVSSQTEESIEGGAQTGYVVATSDGGKTCVKLSRIPGQNLWSVFFLNEREGWVGGIGSLFKTEDGGHTWTKISAE